jgi:hypothetical protein
MFLQHQVIQLASMDWLMLTDFADVVSSTDAYTVDSIE